MCSSDLRSPAAPILRCLLPAPVRPFWQTNIPHRRFASGSVNEMPLNHKIFLAQFDAIKKIAEEGPCVLVGRCADYALEERDDVLSVFIHADLEDRIKNVAKLNELTDNKAKDLIHKTDKRRASYYNYYTNKKWGDAESYDICINSSKFGVDGCVKAIKDFLELEASLEE